MLCQGKYYLCVGFNTQIQVSKHEHERIRNLRKELLIELEEKSKDFIWIDDPSCDETKC